MEGPSYSACKLNGAHSPNSHTVTRSGLLTSSSSTQFQAAEIEHRHADTVYCTNAGRAPQWSTEDWHWEPFALQAYPKHGNSSGFKEPMGKRQRVVSTQQPDLGLSGIAPGCYEIIQNYGRGRHENNGGVPLMQSHNNFRSAASMMSPGQQSRGYSLQAGADFREFAPTQGFGALPSRSSTSGCSGSADLSGMTNPTSPALTRAGGMQLSTVARPVQQQVFTTQGQMWTVQQNLGPPSFMDQQQPSLHRTQNVRHSQGSLLQQQHQHVQVLQSNNQHQHQPQQQHQQQQLLLSQYSDLLNPKPEPHPDSLGPRGLSFPHPRSLRHEQKSRDDMPWMLTQSHSTPPMNHNRGQQRTHNGLHVSHSVPAPSHSHRQQHKPFAFSMPDTQPSPPLGLLHIGSSLGATSTPLGVPMRPTQPLMSSSMTHNPAAPPQSSQSLDPFFAALMEDDDDDPQVPSPGPASPSTHTTGTVGTLVEAGQEVQMPRDSKDAVLGSQGQGVDQDQGDEQWQEQRDDDVCETSQAPERGDGSWQQVPEGTVRILRSCELPHPNRMECQVPGCCKSLQGLRDYHQRYRICDVHIKLPQVMKDGWLQRFCQQCSRFHPVSAFDGVRRSCREQLSKHNLRRRRQRHAPQALDLPKDHAPPPQQSTATPKAGGGGGSGANAASCGAGGSAGGMLPGHGSCSPRGPAPPILPPASSEVVMTDLIKPDMSKAEMARLVSELREQPERLNNLAALVLAAGFSGVGPPSLSGQDPPPLGYVSQHISLRMSFKLFKKTPADLPVDLRQQVYNWLGNAPTGIEGCIRPGCVHLTLQLLLDSRHAAELAAGGSEGLMPALLQRMLTQPGGCACWDEGLLAVQLMDQVAVVNDGQLVSSYSLSSGGSERRPPVLRALSSLALHVGEASQLRLLGSGLGGADCTAIVRSNGLVIASQQCSTPGASDSEASVSVPALSGCRLAFVEVVRECVLSDPLPLLLVDDAALAEEVSGLEQLGMGSVEQQAVLLDLGLVLQAASGQSPPYFTIAMAAAKAQQLRPLAVRQGLVQVLERLTQVQAMEARSARRSRGCRLSGMSCLAARGGATVHCH